MSTTSSDPRALVQAGALALNRRDPAGARDLFERAAQAPHADPAALLGLAIACRDLGDAAARLKALDRLLAQEPRHVRGLILKGDHFHEADDPRAAATFYGAALAAAPPPERLPPEILSELRRARAMTDRYQQDYANHLDAALSAAGLVPDAPEMARFSQSVDLMLGRRTLYLQQPRHYYFPGLPQIQFYYRSGFDWLDGLEAATDAIRTELLAILAEGEGFVPYAQTQPDRPFGGRHAVRDSPDWTAFFLWKDGVAQSDAADRCPVTMAALRDVPLCAIEGRSPSILFSRLKPGARIPPHHGFINARLIGHLPLIVPGACGFRVGNETRFWREGEAWLFDDTIEHEAWNDSDQDRIILIFDIWRPELTPAERDMVRGLFSAVDSYGSGPAQAWGV
ncbi:MAG: aspartyl/asparaginyl beta-hydroxylase domain-containing protein [Caulobacter sp.]|nr:aspartyl/asparaginyl beta-hydroxylase domain-containing protein [Caulobacter sp.]